MYGDTLYNQQHIRFHHSRIYIHLFLYMNHIRKYHNIVYSLLLNITFRSVVRSLNVEAFRITCLKLVYVHLHDFIKVPAEGFAKHCQVPANISCFLPGMVNIKWLLVKIHFLIMSLNSPTSPDNPRQTLKIPPKSSVLQSRLYNF